MKDNMPKSFSNSYLYNSVRAYETNIANFLIKATEINKKDPSFEDIKYDIKRRQVSNFLVKILESEKIVLLTGNEGLPKAFKVICAKDIRGDGKTNKVFIDCSNLIIFDNGKYKCDYPDILIAHLLNATNQYIYYIDAKRLLYNNNIVEGSCRSFSLMFSHIIDYLYKVSSMGEIRNTCLYMSAMYYLLNHLGKDFNETTKGLCRNISGLTQREEDILFIKFDPETETKNIDIFVKAISKVLKLSNLTTEIITEKWIYLYGIGTQFGLELYTAFMAMLSNAYIGCYLNNQKTIEKICGRNMVEAVTGLLRIGSESV